MTPCVVKVGGSLYDDPRLGAGLRAFLEPLAAAGPVCVVPGGGAFADAVRRYDGVHQLGDTAAHWAALRALSAAALFLSALLPGAAVVRVPGGSKRETFAILDGYEFVRGRGGIPESWDVTSDSIAAYAATEVKGRLVLLKSVDIPAGTSWADAAERGWVDRHFPTAVAGLATPVESVNFRRWLDENVRLLPGTG